MSLAASLDAVAAPRDLAWRTFVRRFLLTLAANLIFTALLNYLVNPESIYPVELLPPLTWNTRPAKARMMDQAQPPPQALVLGSSRIMKIDPVLVERLTGLPTFNAGVNAAMTEDYYVLLRYAVEHARLPLRLVIVGVDVDAFHDREPLNDYLLQPNLLGSYLQKGEARHASWKRFTTLFNAYQTKLSFVSLWDSLVHKRKEQYHFEPNGYLHFDKLEAERATGHYDLDAKIATTIDIYMRRYAAFNKLAPERLDYFAKTLQYCRERDIRVIVFLTPAHPRLIAALDTRHYEQRRTDALAAVQRICAEQHVPFYDLSTLDRFDGKASDFFDGVHPDETNSAKITHLLLQSTSAPAGDRSQRDPAGPDQPHREHRDDQPQQHALQQGPMSYLP